MSKINVTIKLMTLAAMMLIAVLTAADQKKNNPPPAPKPAPAPKQVQPAVRPAQRTTAQPARVQPGNTGIKPGRGAGSNPRTGGANPNPHVNAARPRGGPAGTKTPVRTVATRNGGHLEVGPDNKPAHFVGNHGQEAHFGNRGQLREVHDQRRGMRVERGFRAGDRRVVTERNGRRLVSTGPRRGYMERPYYRDHYGHAYVQRTYWVHGHAYAYAYRDHFYGNRHYYWYAPRYYYHPGFYGWAYHPWAAPVYYNWGWGPTAPWFYGGYFAPAPFYPTASLWLTDYLLAENLKVAYENQQVGQETEPQPAGEQVPPPEGGGGASAAAQLTPDQIRQMVDVEVQRQLHAEQSEAQSPQVRAASDQTPPPALDPAQSIFVVSSNLGVSTAEGQECELTPGDVLSRIDDKPGDDNKVTVRVTSAKANDCSVGLKPGVEVSDLQEMGNSFRQQLDAGLDALAKNAGTGGLPKAPDTQTTDGQQPMPDKSVDTQLNDQQKEATQLEAEVRQEVQTAPAANQ